VSSMNIQVLIPAAGKGSRFGGSVVKQYLPIAGRPVLAHSIRAFRFHPLLNGITVVLAENDQWFDSSLGALAGTVETVTGGDTRARSVYNGLRHISELHPETDWVLVHDAARPCLPAECLDRLLDEGLDSESGAILAMPVADTLKQAGTGQEVIGTLDRNDLWQAQTPQLFPLRLLMKAMAGALDAGFEVTDEASAIEHAGMQPRLVMGSIANIKITRPEDLAVAAALLAPAGPTD